jgi:hypothetical protein
MSCNVTGAERLYREIGRAPGRTIGDYARAIGENYNIVYKRLPTLERLGFLVSEDERGGLWPFGECMSTVSDFLAHAMVLPELKDEPVKLDDAHHCALTGTPITEGYPVGKIITGATGDTLGLMNGNVANGYLSQTAARCFKGIRNVGGLVAFEDGTFYKPLISRDSAAKDDNRPCWSDLVREIWPARRGQRMVCVLSTDVKKRTWTRAFVTTLGEATRVYLYDTSRFLKENVFVDWPKMLEILGFVEAIYATGFSKNDIESGLTGNYRLFLELEQAADWETRLVALRGTPEFKFCSIIAQKGA